MKIKDSHDWSEIVFDNGSYLKIHYKYQTEEHIIFHYNFKNVRGTMKIKPIWCRSFNDILGQMECSLPELFFPLILDYFLENENKRLEQRERIVSLWAQGKIEEIKNINWIAYHNINESKIKEMRKNIQNDFLIIKEVKELKKELNGQRITITA
jgi:hypothetical protein